MRAVQFQQRRGASRAGAFAIALLWFLFALTIGTTRAHCLDLDGECSPPAVAPEIHCHDQAPGEGRGANCNSCIDIFVPEDASTTQNRTDRVLSAPAATTVVVASGYLLGQGGTAIAMNAPPIGISPQRPLLRTTILRI